MDIVLDHTTLNTRLTELTTFVARTIYNTEAQSQFINILLTKQEEPLKQSLIANAISIVVDRVGRFVTQSNNDSITITPNIRISLLGSVNENLLDFITFYVLYRWLEINQLEIAQTYKGKADNSLTQLHKLLYTKSEPSYE